MSHQILVVDDSPIVRAMVQKILTMVGAEKENIWQAGNGVEALEVLAKESIELVLADINMPVMNGIELLKSMKKDSALQNISVIMISSDHSEARIQEFKELGVSGYIKKPFRPEQFKDLLNDIFGS